MFFSLSPLQVEDAAAVRRAFAADPQMHLQGDVTDQTSALTYINDLNQPAQGHLGFAMRWDGECIGVIGIRAALQHQLGWFFYWMHPQFRGRGYTAQACTAVANWALSEGGFHRLELGHRVSNPASAAIARHAGFLPEGLERQKFLESGARVDVRTYGRLVTDPIPTTSISLTRLNLPQV